MSFKAAAKRIIKKFMIKQVHTVPVLSVSNELLKGKIALITGGSGGIGFAIAQKFVDSGCKVILCGTNEEKLKQKRELLGKDVSNYLAFDLNNVTCFNDIVIKAAGFYGHIDILVNSAGVHGGSLFANITESEYDEVMNVNLKSMFFMCQAMSEYMIKNKIHGHILNVGSASALKPAWTPYEISKWGVRGFTLGLARELIPYGIVVNSIAPGPVATKMLNLEGTDNYSSVTNPAGRVAAPEEIANLAVFMASDLGNYIVGDSFFISGGSGTVNIDK